MGIRSSQITYFAVQLLLAISLKFCDAQQDTFIEGGLEGTAGNSITLQNYRAIEAAYAREFMRAADSTGSQITFIQQKGTLSERVRELLHKFELDPIELDITSVDQVAENKLINDAYNEESRIYREHLQKVEEFKEDPLEVLTDHMRSILSNSMTIPRSHDRENLIESSYLKDNVATYIVHKFAALGYLTAVQKFTPKHFTHALPTGRNGETVKGTNIIAIAPGTNFGTKSDRILVIGAHWDTVSASPGYNDNGSGMAAMLEMARALKHAECQNVHTYMFVAIDMEETGTQGATAFVQEFLVKSIMKPMNFPEFQGAYILDSIANYNDTEGSQLLPETYQTQLPEFTESVKADGSKGDFIGVIGRKEDQPLYDLFSFHWNNLPDNERKFKLRNMILPEELNRNYPEESALTKNTNFLRSDHIRFWFANNLDYFASLKSVHLSDTGPARGVMGECYHNPCDTAELNQTIPFANINFLKKTTQAIINTVIDATDSQCHKTPSEISRLGRSLDASYNFIDKILKNDSVDQLPTNSNGEPIINSTKENTNDVIRIEDLANVKHSEKSKHPVQPSYFTSNDIPHVVDKKSKPIKTYSKLITKPEKQEIEERKVIEEQSNNIEIGNLSRPPKEQSETVKRNNGHTGQLRKPIQYYFKTSSDLPRSMSHEPAGQYTNRINFQGPLFQPVSGSSYFNQPILSDNYNLGQQQNVIFKPELHLQQPQKLIQSQLQVQPQTMVYQQGQPLFYQNLLPQPALSYHIPFHGGQQQQQYQQQQYQQQQRQQQQQFLPQFLPKFHPIVFPYLGFKK